MLNLVNINDYDLSKVGNRIRYQRELLKNKNGKPITQENLAKNMSENGEAA